MKFATCMIWKWCNINRKCNFSLNQRLLALGKFFSLIKTEKFVCSTAEALHKRISLQKLVVWVFYQLSHPLALKYSSTSWQACFASSPTTAFCTLRFRVFDPIFINFHGSPNQQTWNAKQIFSNQTRCRREGKLSTRKNFHFKDNFGWKNSIESFFKRIFLFWRIVKGKLCLLVSGMLNPTQIPSLTSSVKRAVNVKFNPTSLKSCKLNFRMLWRCFALLHVRATHSRPIWLSFHTTREKTCWECLTFRSLFHN